MIEVDRSRVLAFQRCPRERYYAYHAGPTHSGLQRRKKAIPLQFGSAFHMGASILLLTADIEAAVSVAINYLSDAFSSAEIDFGRELPADAKKAIEYGQQEQIALAEALLRGWWAFEGPSFLEQFELLEVENEGKAQLTPDMTLMFRPDALLKERETGDLYVLSWKTCSYFSQRIVDQAKHDMQSISEVYGILNAQCHDESCPQHGTIHGCNNPQKIEGVLYRWIVKGQRRQDNWDDNLYKQNTHLIYGWMRQSPDGESDWSWAYEFPKEDGTGNTRLGRGWKKVPIWTHYEGGIKQWIDDLTSGKIGPRHMDPLVAVFPQSLPVERRVDEIESWKCQIIAQEQQVGDYLAILDGSPNQAMALDSLFPQHTASCESYSGCQFSRICWEGIEPVVNEFYQIRIPNHKEGEGEE